MGAVLLYPAFFLLMLLRTKNKKLHMIYTLFVTLYLLATISAAYLVLFSNKFYVYTMSVVAVLFHIFAFYLLIKPVYKIDRIRYNPIKEAPNDILTIFTYFVLIVTILNFIFNVGFLSFSGILENAGELRDERVGSGIGVANNSFAGYIHVIAEEFQLVPLVLFFYWSIRYPNRKGVIVMLLISSLFYPILSLIVVSRDVIIRYVVLFLILYYLLSPQMPVSNKKSIKYVFVGVAIAFVGLFILISTSRFGEMSNYQHSVGYSFLSYCGQGFANFSDRFVMLPDGLFPDERGAMHFPIIPGKGRSTLFLKEYANTWFELNSFPTSIGTWIEDCGILVTCLVLLLYTVLIRIVSNTKTYNVFTLIYITRVYEFLYMSIFYFDTKVYIYKLVALSLIIILDVISRRSYEQSTYLVNHKKQ